MPLRLPQQPPSSHSHQFQQSQSTLSSSAAAHRPLPRASASASGATSGAFGAQRRLMPRRTVGDEYVTWEGDGQEGEEARGASEDYWGEQDGEDGEFEQALARTELDFGRGGGMGYENDGSAWRPQPGACLLFLVAVAVARLDLPNSPLRCAQSPPPTLALPPTQQHLLIGRATSTSRRRSRRQAQGPAPSREVRASAAAWSASRGSSSGRSASCVRPPFSSSLSLRCCLSKDPDLAVPRSQPTLFARCGGSASSTPSRASASTRCVSPSVTCASTTRL